MGLGSPDFMFGGTRKPLASAHRLTFQYGLAIALALGSAAASLAKTHPVPLEPNTDSAKCAECHVDLGKGKSVHSAMAGGCLSCHELRVTKDITRVKLTTATPVKLCLQCHTDKDAAQIQGRVHSPAVRDCLQCHDPHSSNLKNQLLKATDAAAKGDNLCLGCHDKGLNVPANGSRHAALDRGCDTCHVVHKTGPQTGAEFRFHLTKASPALCMDCHDTKDVQIAKSHLGQPIEKSDCLTCHDPHQSASPKLMRAFQHSPFESRSCDICHQPAKDGKVVLTSATAKELCTTCHEEQAKQIAAAKVQHAGAQGDCTDCHSPHAGNNPALIRPDTVTACLNCHKEKAELQKKGHLHQPPFEQSCAICHEPHGGENVRLWRTKNVNQLCLECHGPDASPAKLEKEHLVTIFNGKVKLPENYFGKTPMLPLRYGVGHPTQHHPVQDVVNPATNKVVSAISCLSCHQPHASSKPGLLVKDQADNMEFCKTCHTNGLDLKSVKGGGL